MGILKLLTAVLCVALILFSGGCIDSPDTDHDDLGWLAGQQFMVTVNADAGGGTG